MRDMSMGNLTNFLVNDPYKQFPFTVADGAIYQIDYMFSAFHVFTISATSGVTVRFGGSGTPTDIVSAGVGFRLPRGKVTDRVQVINNSGGSVTGIIGLAIGEIVDQRFTASGSIVVKDQPGPIISVADAAITTAAANILVANTARAVAILTNQNAAGGVNMRYGDSSIGAAQGAIILPQQTIIIPTTGDIYVRTESSTGNLAIAYTEYP